MANRWMWAALLVLTAVITRWIPHPPNFSALLAVTLISGLVLPGPLALAVPILGVFAGDLFLGFHDLMWVVYLSLLPMVWMGSKLPELSKKSRAWLQWGAAGLLASILFFITTNLAVWWSSGMYPHTQAGLTTCFVLAIPFFHNSLLSTWIYMGAFAAARRFALNGRRQLALP